MTPGDLQEAKDLIAGPLVELDKLGAALHRAVLAGLIRAIEQHRDDPEAPIVDEPATARGTVANIRGTYQFNPYVMDVLRGRHDAEWAEIEFGGEDGMRVVSCVITVLGRPTFLCQP